MTAPAESRAPHRHAPGSRHLAVSISTTEAQADIWKLDTERRHMTFSLLARAALAEYLEAHPIEEVDDDNNTTTTTEDARMAS